MPPTVFLHFPRKSRKTRKTQIYLKNSYLIYTLSKNSQILGKWSLLVVLQASNTGLVVFWGFFLSTAVLSQNFPNAKIDWFRIFEFSRHLWRHAPLKPIFLDFSENFRSIWLQTRRFWGDLSLRNHDFIAKKTLFFFRVKVIFSFFLFIHFLIFFFLIMQ